MHGTKIAIENFLAVPLPSDIVLPEGELKFFAEQDIEAIVIERKPFFWLKKAVSVGTDFLLTSVTVAPEQCEGHFPDYPVVPLIEIFRIAAQSGLLLVALNLPSDQEPIAGGSDKNRSKINKFIKTPAHLLATAKKANFKAGLYFVDAHVYSDGLEVANAKNIVYVAMAKADIPARI